MADKPFPAVAGVAALATVRSLSGWVLRLPFRPAERGFISRLTRFLQESFGSITAERGTNFELCLALMFQETD